MMPIIERPSNRATRFWRIAVLAAVAAIGPNSEAAAALYYWSPHFEPSYWAPFFPHQRRPAVRHHSAKPIQVPAQDSAKPQEPIVIAISIKKQNLTLYDASGVFATSPISTGMNGHPTPKGVFSVIQKQRFHRSNIYSDAPMPYMQRITWSGIAVHAGVLPCYPASHGCIRVPTSFAVKMWKWTRLGARVVITSGDTSPTSFSHPLLPTQKVASPVAAPPAPPTQVTVDLRKAGEAGAIKPEFPQRIEGLRPSVSRTDGAGPEQRLQDGLPVAGVDVRMAGTSTTGTASEAAPPATAPFSPEAKPVDEPATANPAPKRAGPIAVFISRKDSKLYARQDFAPLFEIPVTIAASDRPLGTHVFTARVDPDDANVLHWSALSLPTPSGLAKGLHGRKAVTDVQPGTLADGPAEALDRIAIPADAMARIVEGLSTGGSIIVSDQGIRGGETGAGTDFIVSLH